MRIQPNSCKFQYWCNLRIEAPTLQFFLKIFTEFLLILVALFQSIVSLALNENSNDKADSLITES